MSTISNVSGSSSIALQMLQQNRKKPDTAELAKDLFSNLDTKGQGYIEKSDLESALNSVSSTSSSSNSADEMFSALDSDSDGKVTQAEVQSTLQKIADQMDEQFNSMRVQAGMQGMGGPGGPGGAGGMPPAPPENDEGFTKDELSAQLEEIGSSDSKRSDLINNIVSNFDKADTDGDGKVSSKEAMAYDKSQNSGTSSSTSSDSTATTSTTDVSANMKLMHQIMDLMRMYSSTNGSTESSSVSTSV